jgi:hypothetical protein
VAGGVAAAAEEELHEEEEALVPLVVGAVLDLQAVLGPRAVLGPEVAEAPRGQVPDHPLLRKNLPAVDWRGGPAQDQVEEPDLGAEQGLVVARAVILAKQEALVEGGRAALAVQGASAEALAARVESAQERVGLQTGQVVLEVRVEEVREVLAGRVVLEALVALEVALAKLAALVDPVALARLVALAALAALEAGLAESVARAGLAASVDPEALAALADRDGPEARAASADLAALVASEVPEALAALEVRGGLAVLEVLAALAGRAGRVCRAAVSVLLPSPEISEEGLPQLELTGKRWSTRETWSATISTAAADISGATGGGGIRAPGGRPAGSPRERSLEQRPGVLAPVTAAILPSRSTTITARMSSMRVTRSM